MGSIITRAKKLRIARMSSQISALILLNLQFLNRWLAAPLDGLRGACVPGFYCHSCPWAVLACPLGVIVNFARLGLVPYITLGILGLVGTLGGRLVCGWVCPFGFLQDLLFKLRTHKFQIPARLAYAKYLVLVVFVLAVPHFNPTASQRLYSYTFCDGCPSGTLESTIPWAFVGHWDVNSGVFGGFTTRFFVRISILLATLIFVIFVSRGFCRVFCPLGAIFGLFNRFSVFRYDLAHKKCNNCSACAKVCPVHIDPVTEMNSAECIRCYECTNTRHIKMGLK